MSVSTEAAFKRVGEPRRAEAGFTLIELLMAMTVFSFMLLIVVVGFMNVVRIHNQAIASNYTQDNARTAMNELVRAVRDSTAVLTPAAGAGSDRLCLTKAGGTLQGYYIDGTTNALMRATDCNVPGANPVAVTNPVVQVTDLSANNETVGAKILKPQINISITIASNNGTTTGGGATVKCTPTNQDRQFCSTITLTSGAVPR